MTTSWITIDGAEGEGGGQVLRTSLALSMITGIPFRMINIRAKRENPGLQAQHLQALQAAALICHADVKGATLRSSSVEFIPGPVESGTYRIDIGTAGAISLVFHTLFLPLALAQYPSHLTITGGTHVNWSPPFEHLETCFGFMMKKIGLNVDVHLEKAGFYPKGGGEVRAMISPTQSISPLHLTDRGEMKSLTGKAVVSNLPDDIAQRMKSRAIKSLRERGLRGEITLERCSSIGQGAYLFLEVEYEHAQAGFIGLGERGKRAERVADEATQELFRYLNSNGVIDRYLADQLVLPLAFAKGRSTLTISEISHHLRTNLETIQKFLDLEVEIREEPKQGFVSLEP
ncbi:MAG: RNA 3'-terminal phosphate cyclase [Candidatus Tectomicrobia bacterium]|nr:RNA 3'-terminal phosphate cyclase [Candidatus Tectomicrobia bacterium]